MAFYSYLPGIVPAVITGFVYQWWLYRRQPNNGSTREALVGFVIGYCATAMLTFLLLNLANPSGENSMWFGLVGGCSGAVCVHTWTKDVDGKCMSRQMLK